MICVLSFYYFLPALKHYFYPVDEFMPGDFDMVREIVGIIASAEANGEVGLAIAYHMYRSCDSLVYLK